jgi:hypothetical protein
MTWRQRLLSGSLFYVVVIEKTAEQGLTADVFGTGRFVRIIKPVWYEIIYSLVRSLLIVMRFNTFKNMPEMPFSQRDDIVQCFPGLPDKSFGIGITHGCLGRRFNDPDAVSFYYVIKRHKT